MSATELLQAKCAHTTAALGADAIAALLPQVPGWSLQGKSLCRRFALRDFHATMEFANALAFMIHAEDHHPHMVLGYDSCTLSYRTDSAGDAVSENDFICAAKANALYAQRAGA